MRRKFFFAAVVLMLIHSSLDAQSHVSVPVDNPIYNILEQAQIKGLINTLPALKPYSRAFIVEVIEKILDVPPGRLSYTERAILERELEKFRPAQLIGQIDWRRGSYSFGTEPEANTKLLMEVGAGLQMAFSGAHYSGGFEGNFWGMEHMPRVFARGDIGENVSLDFNFIGTIVRAPRRELGQYWTFYDEEATGHTVGGTNGRWPDAINRQITVFSQPLTSFPHAFGRNWDGGYFLTGFTPGDFDEWPDPFGVGPHLLAEISGSNLNDALTWRFGRIRREWAAMSVGQSLTLNSAAQPFLGMEASFRPFSWFGFSSMTGVLEYLPAGGEQFVSAWSSQALFSIEQLELNFGNYFHFALGTTTVWGKRLELGYIFPLIPNFLAQAYAGDFDNSGIFMNLRGQLPGVGRLWFSVFIDDVIPATIANGTFWQTAWNQYAYQLGTRVAIPWFGSFTSVVLSYTKNEPYNYTHRRINAPWHNSNSQFSDDPQPLATAYQNNGASLGHYIPPNSDELLFRIETMPTLASNVFAQYQLTRHGATHGPSAVAGSHLLSELDPHNRQDKPVLRKFFLRDGAYLWQNIFRIGGNLMVLPSSIPVTLLGDFGVVQSFYTNIDGPPNSGSPSSFRTINTDDYPRSVGIIASLGFRLFF